jgi:hypothetical protein
VHAQDFIINDRRNRQAIETISECLPQLDVVPTLALIVKPVNAVDACALMVPTQQKEILRVLYLVSKHQTNCFERLFASVDVIAEEEVVALRRVAAILK